MSNGNGTLPHGWRLARFDEFLRRIERKVILDDSATYPCVGIRLYGNGAFIRETLTGLEITRKQQWILKSGDVVYNKLFAWKGTFTIADDSVDGCIVSDKFPIYEADLTKINRRFLGYYFRMPQLWKQAQDLSRGAAALSKLTLNPPEFWELTIPLPPLSEQQRIVARIEALAARIEEARGLRRGVRAEAEVLWLSSVGEILSSIREASSLKEGASVICGQHLTPEEQGEAGIPYITGPADFTGRMAVPTRYATVMKATSQPGDILLTVKGAGVGKVNLAPASETVIGRQLFAIRPYSDKLDTLFLLFVLQYKLSSLRDAMTATTVPGIGRDDVETLEIPFPSLPEQRRIVAYLDDLHAKADALKRLQAEAAAELEALLPSVLDQAFRGAL